MSGLGAPKSSPALVSQQSQSMWATVKEAIRGSHQDFTEAPVARAVVLLAVPMVLEMLMESVFVVADVFFVGRLGPDAVATVGITESWMTVMYALAAGLSIGAMAMVARRIGEKDRDGAARAGVQSILLGLAAAIVLGAIGALFGPRLLAIMGASDDVLRTGSTFSRVMLGGCGTVLMLFLMNAVFRGAGDAAIAMRVLWFANAINIILGPCLIFGIGPFPELGVTGAAIGTTIGRGSGVLYQFYRLTRRGGRIEIHASHLGLDTAVMKSILRISGTATFQNFIATASWMGLVRILTGFGSAAVGRQHHRHSHHSLRAAAVIRRQQRRRDTSGPEPRRRQARSRRSGGVEGGTLQHDLPRHGGSDLPVVRDAADLTLHQRPRGGTLRRRLPAHRLSRIPLLRIRDGVHGIVQRRRRHAHANLHSPRVSLDVGDPPCLGAGPSPGLRPDRRVHRGERGFLDDGAGQRMAVFERVLEDEEGVIRKGDL